MDDQVSRPDPVGRSCDVLEAAAGLLESAATAIGTAAISRPADVCNLVVTPLEKNSVEIDWMSFA
jgi:hypothetical protein